MAEVMYGRSGRQDEDQTAGRAYGQWGIQAKQQDEVTWIWLQEKEYEVSFLTLQLFSADGLWTVWFHTQHRLECISAFYLSISFNPDLTQYL